MSDLVTSTAAKRLVLRQTRDNIVTGQGTQGPPGPGGTLATPGFVANISAGNFVARTFQGSTGLSISNPAGTAGDPVFSLAAPLVTLASATVAAFGLTMLATAAAADGRTALGLGTLAELNAAPAGTLTGATLAANVLASSLTSVGTLANLTVTNPIIGSVTTNANLTGPITSVGNATSVAAQTGTGSTFVMQASPTLTTPNIGVATGTSFQGIVGNVTPAAGSFTTLSSTGAAVIGGILTVNAFMIQVGVTGTGTGGNVRYVNDAGATKWLTGLLGSAAYNDFVIRDVVASSDRLHINGTTGAATFSGAVSATTSLGLNSQVFLFPDAANTLAQRNGVNAQTFRSYNTFTDSSNYERGAFTWSANVLRIGTQMLGTGVARSLTITIGNADVWSYPTTGHYTPAVDNSFDLGATSSRVRVGYFGTSVNIGGTSVPVVALEVTGTQSTTVEARVGVVATSGSICMGNGGASNSGLLSFLSVAGTRQGYIGFSTSTASSDAGTIPYVAGIHAFSGDVRVNSPNALVGANLSALSTRTVTSGTDAVAAVIRIDAPVSNSTAIAIGAWVESRFTAAGVVTGTRQIGVYSQVRSETGTGALTAIDCYSAEVVQTTGRTVAIATGFRSVGASITTGTVSNYTAFIADNQTSANITTAIGLRCQQAAGTNKWNIYADGTANNIILGKTAFAADFAAEASIDLMGGLTQSAWGINGIGLRLRGNTYTDSSTAVSGTAATNHVHAIAAPTLAATNATVTTTTSATLFIAGPPVAGTNMVITNPFALLVASGQVGFSDGSVSLPAIAFGGEKSTGFIRSGVGQLDFVSASTRRFRSTGVNFTFPSDGVFGWESSSIGSGADLSLLRDAANTLAQRNGVNAQTLRVYNTFTDSSNYERIQLGWSSNNATLYVNQAGTGLVRNLFVGTLGAGSTVTLVAGGADRWLLSSAGVFRPSVDNTQDIGTTGNRLRTGYFGTSLFVGTTTAPLAAEILSAAKTATNTSGSERGAFIIQSSSPASASTADNITLQVRSQATTANMSGASVRGLRADLVLSASIGAVANYIGVESNVSTAAGSSVSTVYGFLANGPVGAGTIGVFHGFFAADATATSVVGFRSSVSSGANKWSLYVDGTANNALAGNVRIGSVVAPTVALDVTGAGLFSTSVGLNNQVFLFPDAANSLAQRNGVNAQAFRVYNTFTDASNFERGALTWSANVLRIGTQMLGTGVARAMTITIGNTDVWSYPTTGHYTPAVDNAYDIGTAALRVKQTYTSALSTGIVTNTAATYTVLATDHTIIQTTAPSAYTLPAAASFTGRILRILTQFAGAVISASSNVVPLAGGAAGTAILAATAGKFADLQSNGTNWITINAN